MRSKVLTFALLCLMLASAAGAALLKPTQLLAEQGPQVDLEKLVPAQIGEWVEEPATMVLAPDPQQAAMLNQLYSQLLNRTYRNPAGYRIMLSIAYGSNQRDAMQVHKPEVCYPAQGFALKDVRRGTLALDTLDFPVVRVVAAQGSRNEPITYWTTVGEQVVRGGIDKKLAEMRFGLTGAIPDGTLIRISSIDQDTTNAFEIQQAFAEALLRSTAAEGQKRFFGKQF